LKRLQIERSRFLLGHHARNLEALVFKTQCSLTSMSTAG
jgi:hypothetical protein